MGVFETPAAPSTVVYCTAADVAAYLQIDPFTDSPATVPTLSQVNDLILRAQDDIDRQFNHAWRQWKVTGEYHRVYPLEYRYSLIVSQPRIELNHREIVPLSSAAGDKLEIYLGTTDNQGWQDWLDPANGKVESRSGGDFWVDYENGFIYFNRYFFWWQYVKGVRVTYRFGGQLTAYPSGVPYWVKDLTVKMAAIEILRNFKQYTFTGMDQARPGVSAEALERSVKEEIAERKKEDSWLVRKRRPRMI